LAGAARIPETATRQAAKRRSSEILGYDGAAMALTTSNFASPRPVEAAGAILWRPGPHGLEVALIHRPRYDDWSFPKGKMATREHVLLTAMREVFEETGRRMVLGRRLPAISYTLASSGAVKRVRYWAGRALPESEGGARFEPNSEVDRLAWLNPQEARDRLTRPLDATVLDAFLTAPADTVPIVLLRHGTAEPRSQRYADDRIRPLAARGHADAEALVDLLACFGRLRVVSSPAVRCVDTVRPFAVRQRVVIDIDPALSEPAHRTAPGAAAPWIRLLIAKGEPTVVCAHRAVLDCLLTAVLDQAGLVTAVLPQPTPRAEVTSTTAGDAVARTQLTGPLHWEVQPRRALPEETPSVNGHRWSRRQADRLLGTDLGGGRLAPGRAWILHVTRPAGPRRSPRLVAIDRLKP
jgi:8-oxo-dGTP diphosphatase